MTDYLILSLSLVIVSILILVRLRIKPGNMWVLLITASILLIMMLIFDTYLTALPIVWYNNKSILGLKLGTIPIEDFGYLIASIILVPALFKFFSEQGRDDKKR